VIVSGVTAADVFNPASIEEAAALLKELAQKRRTVAIVGGGTALDMGNPPDSLDAVVSTTRLNRIVEHEPADQIVTTEAGITLRALQEQLLPSRQRIALDPPLPARATLGGIVATNAYGPRRARYGTVKDLIVGMTIVRPDGTIARGGGKVVKNVAGFDIPKLMVGSFGTLAMIASVTLRLHPLPEAERALGFDGCSAEQMRLLVRDLMEAQLEPSIVLAAYHPPAYSLCIRFEGFGPGVDAQIAALREIGQRRGLRAEELSPADWAPSDEAHAEVRTTGAVRVKVTAPASSLARLHEHVILPIAKALERSRIVLFASLGIGFIAGAPERERVVGVLAGARAFVEELGGTLVITAAPPDLRAQIDSWGTPPPSFALMQNLKARFDPERRFNPGRFVGGL
jgi:glycolate oxidase FAD binding subunit